MRLWVKDLANGSGKGFTAKRLQLGSGCTTGDREHVQKEWFQKCLVYEYAAAEGAVVLKNLQPAVEILPASNIQFRQIVEYDASVYGFSRERFLKKWLYASNSHSYVATDEEGKVSGYVVVRSTLKQDEGWKIGPLFADDPSIARSLYKAVFDRLSGEDENAKVIADVPYGRATNQQAIHLLEEIPSTTIGMGTRMYTRGIPTNLLLQKIYGHTALEIY